jgi:hypothetical protein
VNAALVTGLSNPEYIAIDADASSAPEPGTITLLGLGLGLAALEFFRRKRIPS